MCIPLQLAIWDTQFSLALEMSTLPNIVGFFPISLLLDT